MDDLADRSVDEWAGLDTIGARYVGISGYDHALPDLSPEGYAAQAELERRTLAELAMAEPADGGERVAKEARQARLGLALERYEAGDVTSQLNVIASALHSVRSIFDLMPLAGEAAASDVAARMGKVPRALAQLRQTLDAAADAGHVSARHQIIEVAKQCAVWTDQAGDNFYPNLSARVLAAGELPGSLRADIEAGAPGAHQATPHLGRDPRTQHPPRRPAQEGGRPGPHPRAPPHL